MNNKPYTVAKDRAADAELIGLPEAGELEELVEFVSTWDDYYREWEPVTNF